MNDDDGEKILRSSRRASVRHNNQFGYEEDDDDDGSSAAAVGEKRQRRETLPDIAKRIPLDRLRPCLNSSLVNAAKELGISPTTLKRLCRLYGIKRWPYRQIVGVDRTVKRLEVELESSKHHLPRVMHESMAKHIRELRLHRQGMVELTLERRPEPVRGKLVSTGTDILGDSPAAEQSVQGEYAAGADRLPPSPVGVRQPSTFTTKARCPATPDQITSASRKNSRGVYKLPAIGRGLLRPATARLGKFPDANATSGAEQHNPASLETALAATEALATSVNGRIFGNVYTKPATLPPGKSCLSKAFSFGADLVGGQDRPVIGVESLSSGQLSPSSMIKDSNTAPLDDERELNYISQPFMAAPGLSLPSSARFGFCNRHKCNNQREPRNVCQVPMDLPEWSSEGSEGSTASTAETCVTHQDTKETGVARKDTRNSVGPIFRPEAGVGAKGQKYRETGESVNFSTDDIHDLAELMFDSSDDYDPGTDGWWLQLSPGGEANKMKVS